jgi:hypothetical protein
MKRIKRDIGQCIPVRKLTWPPDVLNIALNNQQELVAVVNDSKWSASFLNFIIRQAEIYSIDIDESVYLKITSLLTNPTKPTLIKTYWLDNDYVEVCEDVADISHGTTGLRVWQASLLLLEYLLDDPSRIKNLNVLEIGSGCGLIGLGCLKLNARSVVMTDTEQLVLDRIHRNLKINNKICRVDYLDWRDPSWISNDIILCADIVSIITPILTNRYTTRN